MSVKNIWVLTYAFVEGDNRDVTEQVEFYEKKALAIEKAKSLLSSAYLVTLDLNIRREVIHTEDIA